jgi:hypothetical protein
MAFSREVASILWNHRLTFFLMMVLYSVITALFVGIASQDTFTTLSQTLRSTGSSVFTGNFGGLGQASLLFLSAVTGSSAASQSQTQQIYGVIVGLLTWLSTVWLLRNILAGRKAKLRDAVYGSGGPLLSTFIVLLVLLVQLLPIAIAAIGYEAASTTGLLKSGVEAMLFWFAAGFLALLSIYWLASTLFALVVVTLPGMYPFRALKISGDLVVGRRVRIFLRIVWMVIGLILLWAVISIPLILLDTWVKGIFTNLENIPTIPFLLLVLGSFSIVWVSTYIYMLYRKVVDDDALPA